MKVVVKSVFKENEFDAKDGMRGAQVLDILLRNEGIVETWYFGLMYLQDNEEVWIDKSKKVGDIYNFIDRFNYILIQYCQ